MDKEKEKLQENIEAGKVYLDERLEHEYKTYSDNLMNDTPIMSFMSLEKPTDDFLSQSVDLLNKELYDMSKYIEHPKHIILNKNDPGIRKFILETGIAYSTFMDMQWKRLFDLIQKRCGYSNGILNNEFFHFGMDQTMEKIGKLFDDMAETKRKSGGVTMEQCYPDNGRVEDFTCLEHEEDNDAQEEGPTEKEMERNNLKDVERHQDELDNPSPEDIAYADRQRQYEKMMAREKQKKAAQKIRKFRPDQDSSH